MAAIWLGIFGADGSARPLSLCANQGKLLGSCATKNNTTPSEVLLKKLICTFDKHFTAISYRHHGNTRQDLGLRHCAGL